MKKTIFYISILFLFIFLFIPKNLLIIIIEGNSMEPTLKNGEVYILNKKEIEVNNIIIFESPESWKMEDLLIKRIIATSGDVVEFKDNVLYINNKNTLYYEYNKNIPKTIIPKDYVFVVGDNLKESTDSLFFFLNNQEFLVHKKNIKKSF